MVKVVIERRIKSDKGKAFQQLASHLRATAATKPGFLDGETLVFSEDSSINMVVLNWQDRQSWDAYRSSHAGRSVAKSVEPLLSEPDKIRVFEPEKSEIHWDAHLPYDPSVPVV